MRARVFKAIENYADSNTKQAAGFQWQNPAAAKVHEDPDTKLVALLVKDFLEYYKMDYTMSVYLPEIALSRSTDMLSRDEMAAKAGLPKSNDGPLLLQLLKQRSNQAPAPNSVKKQEEETKTAPSKSPFGSNKVDNKPSAATEEIEEDIV